MLSRTSPVEHWRAVVPVCLVTANQASGAIALSGAAQTTSAGSQCLAAL